MSVISSVARRRAAFGVMDAQTLNAIWFARFAVDGGRDPDLFQEKCTPKYLEQLQFYS